MRLTEVFQMLRSLENRVAGIYGRLVSKRFRARRAFRRALVVEGLENRQVFANDVLVVTVEDGNGPGTLSQMIQLANAQPGPDKIIFATVLDTIRPMVTLPPITDALVIDGQNGVRIDGIGSLGDGLTISGPDVVLQDFAIVGFQSGAGVKLYGGYNTRLHGMRIGIDYGDVAARPNKTGVDIIGSAITFIGTNGDGVRDVEEGNIISGNSQDGIYISDSVSTVVAGNRIGTKSNGIHAMANGRNGIFVYQMAADTRIGSDNNGISDIQERNIISGNAGSGVLVADTGPSRKTLISGNYVGIASDYITATPNGSDGVSIRYTTVMKGTDRVLGNVISGNAGSGVSIAGASGTILEGNIVGLTADGLSPLGNLGTAGVVVSNDSSKVRIGTNGDNLNDTMERNIIAGNSQKGIVIEGASDSVVSGNYIGTNRDGAAAVPNRTGGIHVKGGSNTRIGTDGSNDVFNANERNLISGNGANGVTISQSAQNTVVAGNWIGLNASGVGVISNTGNGIELSGDSANTIVGTNGDGSGDSDERNIISGNNRGIAVGGAGQARKTIAGNWVGLDAGGANALGNNIGGGDGIWLVNGASNVVVGTNGDGVSDTLERNTVAGHTWAGIGIYNANTSGNVVAGNLVGMNSAGTLPLGNLWGISVGFPNGSNGPRNNLIGTNSDGISDDLEQNVVSGNSVGVYLFGVGTNNNSIAGNFVGINPAGTTSVPNSIGVSIADGPSGTRIGTNSDGLRDSSERNFISGNNTGIQLTGASTSNVSIAGNYIGAGPDLRPIGNLGAGVVVNPGPTGVSIGGAQAGSGNVIANNSVGVRLSKTAASIQSFGNTRFWSNSSVAVDVGTDGQTPNDLNDLDGVLNAPVITSVLHTGDSVIVEGFARPGVSLDFYKTSSYANGFGQGEAFLRNALEGGVLDTDATVGSYDSSSVGGIPVGVDTTNRFRFVFPSSSLGYALSSGDYLTARVSLPSSEFGNQAVVRSDFKLTHAKILENAGANAAVGAFLALAPSVQSDFTYSLVAGVGGNDNSSFNVLGNVLRANSSFDFETKSSYSIRVRSTDSLGYFTERVFSISVIDRQETAPVDIRFASTIFSDDFSSGLGQWSNLSGRIVSDPNYSGRGGVLTFGQLNAGGDIFTNMSFSANESLTVAFDYLGVPGMGGVANDLGGFVGVHPRDFWLAGTSPTWATPTNLIDDNLWRKYAIDWTESVAQRLKFEDWNGSGGVAGDALFDNIRVTRNSSSATIPENSGANALVSMLDAKDADPSSSFVFTLVPGAGDTNNSDFTIVEGNLRAINSFDFEVKSSYSVRVRATDESGLFVEKALTINVADLDENRYFDGLATADSFIATYTGDGTQAAWTLTRNGASVFSGSIPNGGALIINALAGVDTLQVNGRAVDDLMTIDANRITVNNAPILFSNTEIVKVVAGLGNDNLLFVAPAASGVTLSYDGGAGSDRIETPSGSNIWNVTGTGIGNVNAKLSFLGTETLVGGSGNDQFILANAGKVTGQILGGTGSDTLNLAAKTTAHTINLQSNTATSTGGISGIESFIGGNTASVIDVLVGPNSDTNWSINGSNAGSVSNPAVGTVTFSNFESLTGGTAADNFVFTNSGSISNVLTGGTTAGILDTLDLSAKTAALDFRLDATTSSIPSSVGSYLGFETITGNSVTGSKITRVNNTTTAWSVNTLGQIVASNVTYRNVPGIAGGIGADTLTGPSLASGIATWKVNSANGGTLSIPSLATIAFSGVDGLTGGTGEDAFEISPTGSLSGSLNGGTGVGLNSLSYSQWVAGVTVNLAVATAANSTAIAGLTSNIQIVTGGSGNDTLRGAASKATVLIGLAGNDTLAGGSQRDLLIGGVGLDLLQSANGDDLLVSGRTSFDTNRDALKAIYNEWNSARTFSQRTANIWGNGTGVRNNGSYFFNSNLADAITDTVFADSDADSLTGGLNQDWFFASGNDLTDFVGAGTAPDRLDN